MKQAQTHYFYDSGIFGRVQTPAQKKQQYYSSLETPRYLNEIKKITRASKNILFLQISKNESPENANVGKCGHREMIKDRVTNLENLGYEIKIFLKT